MKVLKSKYNYLILATTLGVYGVIMILQGGWSGDFWEHCAVVKELTNNLANPTNPMIRADIPHAFFSPYSVVVSLFSKISGFSPIESLEFFAFFNLIFFLFSFYLFCKSLFKEDYNIIASISLILTLFFWGNNPYKWSGFFHFTTLHYVLPYPSTFAMALVFLILAVVLRDIKQDNYYFLSGIIALNSVVAITHPTTVIPLNVSIVAIYFVYNGYSVKKCFLKSSKIIIPSLILCLLWPYYNLFDLLSGNTADFHSDSIELYKDFYKRIWPLLTIIPYLFFYKKDHIIDFLLITITLLFLIYIGGYILGVYGFSRVISNIMMLGHFLIAYIIYNLIKESRFKNKIYLTILSVAFFASVIINKGDNYHTFIQVFKEKDIRYYEKFSFLKTMVKSDDLILSHGLTNWMIPAFNGKVLSSGHPLYWVDDIVERRQNLNIFFSKSTTDSIREGIINKYVADYVLLNHNIIDLDKSTYKWIKSKGNSIYKKDELELVKLSKTR
ncbi:hypothetical protein [uncultured Algibacter sp.]|uniref:hypothetical protein n=1 Tax=uncultured Algibacter sp. TaxID=298659 RepID=UPI0026108655|nr:hypothetical protein [uncultured Algibacter sp.]